MIRIRLGAHGLGSVRFALSPVGCAKDLLSSLRARPGTVAPSWRARTTRALSRHRLGLLAVTGAGGPLGYTPDFLRPEPGSFLADIDTELHTIAATSRERIRYEMTAAVGGHSWDPDSSRPAPRSLLEALDRGEDHFAHRLADELALFWREALAPSWPAIRARLEADVTARASQIARYGLVATLNGLAPNLQCGDGDLIIAMGPDSPHRLTLEAQAAIMTPSVFYDRAVFCAAEPPGVPAPRSPLIVYPATPSDCLPPAQDHPLIGATRLRLLAELSQPRSTTEIAQRLYLSPATASYHLQILYRAGLVTRTRHSRNVLYQRREGSPSAGRAPSAAPGPV